LLQQHILLVQGSAFNVPEKHYLRFVFLPHVEDLIVAIERLATFLQQYKRHERYYT
jgi:alanine-synthesizing transaminase